MTGLALACAAEALVGTPFRLHGRDPVIGLDCVGLLSAALAAIGRPAAFPNGYALRNTSVDRFLPDPAAIGFIIASGQIEPGDVLLVQSGPALFHLLVAARHAGFVHAHAGLRRVVHSAGPGSGKPCRHWRLAS